jgi:hypothetical protein
LGGVFALPNLNKTDNVTLRRVRAKVVAVEKAISIKYSECVLVALGIHHAMRMRHIFICGPPDSIFSPHYLMKGTLSIKKIIENKNVL